MRTPLAVAAIVTIAFLPLSGAWHCSTFHTTPAKAQAGGYYLDIDLCQPNCLYSAWIYAESNGILGLQRGDDWVDDTCHGLIEPDTVVF